MLRAPDTPHYEIACATESDDGLRAIQNAKTCAAPQESRVGLIGGLCSCFLYCFTCRPSITRKPLLAHCIIGDWCCRRTALRPMTEPRGATRVARQARDCAGRGEGDSPIFLPGHRKIGTAPGLARLPCHSCRLARSGRFCGLVSQTAQAQKLAMTGWARDNGPRSGTIPGGGNGKGPTPGANGNRVHVHILQVVQWQPCRARSLRLKKLKGTNRR